MGKTCSFTLPQAFCPDYAMHGAANDFKFAFTYEVEICSTQKLQVLNKPSGENAVEIKS